MMTTVASPCVPTSTDGVREETSPTRLPSLSLSPTLGDSLHWVAGVGLFSTRTKRQIILGLSPSKAHTRRFQHAVGSGTLGRVFDMLMSRQRLLAETV